GATTGKNALKIGKTDGEQDLPVSLRGAIWRPALHQLVIGVKHDAKLLNHFAEQIPGNVKFSLSLFLQNFCGCFFCD
ncbi:MAG TPA: hypothetical protein VF630_05140, partial [Hymenobacter sp.]